jgi:hypothetical protein
MDVLYDTMSDWTVIDQDYDPDQSTAAKPWLDDDYNIYNDVVVDPSPIQVLFLMSPCASLEVMIIVSFVYNNHQWFWLHLVMT